MYFVIWNHISNQYLSRISIGSTPFTSPVGWSKYTKGAIHFSSQEEAQATINFMDAVITPVWTAEYEIRKVSDLNDGFNY